MYIAPPLDRAQAREPYIKEVDPTWTPNVGLLEEMSLAELK